MKIKQAKQQDEQSQKRFNDQKSELEILGMSPQDLIKMMPSSESRDALAQRPCALAIKKSLETIEAAKLKKEELIRQAVENLANLNMIEELMEVHQGQKQKDGIFSSKKEEFN